DGSLYWNQLYVTPVRDPGTGSVTHFIGVQHDVTELKHYQDELEHRATHDSLTGLPNRSLLKDRLQQAQAPAQRSGPRFTVGLLGLDNFKSINDSLGHDMGDRVLKVVAARLRHCVGPGDTVSRYGGDEFVLLVSDHASEADVHRMIHKVMSTMQEPVAIGERE